MAFEFDAIDHLDTNFDGIVTDQDINQYGLMNEHGFLALDMNQDMIYDKYQWDLNGNMQVDKFEFDLNNNHLIDSMEFKQLNTTMTIDINNDGKLDAADVALASVLLPK